MIRVSNNIYLVSEGFGLLDIKVATCLLRSVDLFFSTTIGIKPFSTKKVIVAHHHASRPNCCSLNDDTNLIHLTTVDNYWCQLVYQFAHEYCHHLIDGELSGTTEGMKWFEEALCHVSSVANLINMVRVCSNSPLWNLKDFTPEVIDYIENLQGIIHSDIIRACLPSISNPFNYTVIPQSQIISIKNYLIDEAEILANTYSDEHYFYVCRALYPHFHNNPNLWKIIPHIGDSGAWISLNDLYKHLLANADNSYRESLSEMFGYLMG